MQNRSLGLITIHSAVLLFALSALFGKWLDLPPSYIVFGRTLFAFVAIALVALVFSRQLFIVSLRSFLPMLATAALLAIHWVSFFASIQYSSVTIGLITFATFPVFTSLLEPLLFKEKYRLKSLIQAGLTLLGILLVLPQVQIGEQQLLGVALGIGSAFTFALLTVVNRKFVISIHSLTLTLYQNGFAALLLLPIVLTTQVSISFEQLSGLVLLGVVFTAVSHSLFNYALTKISAHTVSVAVSLEPIYGIVAAMILLNESLTIAMTLGISMVLAANYWSAKSN